MHPSTERKPGDGVEVKAGLWLPRRLEQPLPPAKDVRPSSCASPFPPNLAGVPADFVADSLARLGPELLESVCNCVPLSNSPNGAKWWRPDQAGEVVCERRRSGPAHSRTPDSLRPSHLFEVSFADNASAPAYLVPAHDLVWAAKCKTLSRLGQNPSPQTTFAATSTAPANPFPLSTVQLRLPSTRAWPFIHSWIYLGRPDQLGSHLMTFDSPEPPSPPASPLLSTASGAVGPFALSPIDRLDTDQLEPFYPEAVATGFPSATEVAWHNQPAGNDQPFAPSRAAVLDRASLVNTIWRTMVALGIEDDELWGHMDGVWQALVAMLERRQPDGQAA